MALALDQLLRLLARHLSPHTKRRIGVLLSDGVELARWLGGGRVEAALYATQEVSTHIYTP